MDDIAMGQSLRHSIHETTAGLLQNMYIHSSPLNFALHLPESFLELVELERSRFELILQIRVIML